MNLSCYRDKIDEIDSRLLDLFLERMDCAANIARIKHNENLPVLNATREREVLSNVCKKSGDLEAYSYRLFRTLMELSRAYQESLYPQDSPLEDIFSRALSNPVRTLPKNAVVACQGVEGAYSQIAADKLFPHGKIVFVDNFEDVFGAVEDGLCEYGVLPIENSTNGSVRAVYGLLATKDAYIARGLKLCISHELLAKPGTRMEDVTTIYSHEQAIGQCSMFLKSLGGNVNVIPVSNTAVAAKSVHESLTPGCASISSRECGDIYGLSPIMRGIQNSENNYTRFICISKEPMSLDGADHISISLTTMHKPGALYEIISRIAALDINIFKLESCPIIGRDFEFRFFIDMGADLSDYNVRSLIKNLSQVCRSVKFLGSYPLQ